MKKKKKILTLSAVNTLRKQLETKFNTPNKVNEIVGKLKKHDIFERILKKNVFSILVKNNDLLKSPHLGEPINYNFSAYLRSNSRIDLVQDLFLTAAVIQHGSIKYSIYQTLRTNVENNTRSFSTQQKQPKLFPVGTGTTAKIRGGGKRTRKHKPRKHKPRKHKPRKMKGGIYSFLAAAGLTKGAIFYCSATSASTLQGLGLATAAGGTVGVGAGAGAGLGAGAAVQMVAAGAAGLAVGPVVIGSTIVGAVGIAAYVVMGRGGNEQFENIEEAEPPEAVPAEAGTTRVAEEKAAIDIIVKALQNPYTSLDHNGNLYTIRSNDPYSHEVDEAIKLIRNRGLHAQLSAAVTNTLPGVDGPVIEQHMTINGELHVINIPYDDNPDSLLDGISQRYVYDLDVNSRQSWSPHGEYNFLDPSPGETLDLSDPFNVRLDEMGETHFGYETETPHQSLSPYQSVNSRYNQGLVGSNSGLNFGYDAEPSHQSLSPYQSVNPRYNQELVGSNDEMFALAAVAVAVVVVVKHSPKLLKFAAKGGTWLSDAAISALKYVTSSESTTTDQSNTNTSPESTTNDQSNTNTSSESTTTDQSNTNTQDIVAANAKINATTTKQPIKKNNTTPINTRPNNTRPITSSQLVTNQSRLSHRGGSKRVTKRRRKMSNKYKRK